MDFSKKKVVIVGARHNIGERLACRMLEQGANVLISDPEPDNLSRVESELNDFDAFHLCLADTSVRSEAKMLFDSAIYKLEEIDVWINIVGTDFPYVPFMDSTEESWKSTIDRTLQVVFNCCSVALPHFRQKESGRIVNTLYENSFSGHHEFSIFSTVKAGVIEFTRTLSREVGEYGIYANAVSIGRTLTDKDQMLEIANGQTRMDELKNQYSLRRLGNLDDATNALMFIASDLASWITGQNLVSDGGL